MRFYLSHPFDERESVRKIELDIEKETGIDLFNPFYDLVRPEVIQIDNGGIRKFDESLDFVKIVNMDLLAIYESDAILTYIANEQTIGTSCEMWFAISIGRPLYLINDKFTNHPWIRYMLKVSEGKAFNNWEEFKEYIKGEICSKN